jgi:phosphoribosylamine--glycine ligase
MNVLVIGSGGREHALVWALHRSPTVRQVFLRAGERGHRGLAECADVQHQRRSRALAFHRSERDWI